MAGSIQFKGIEQVMAAFQNRDVDAWSVWQHRQFMFKGMGDAELRTLLDNLAASATNAIYTIKVYETIAEVKNIKEKTDCDGSFNFRLNADGQEITGSQYYQVNRYGTLEKEIADLKLQIKERDEEEDDEPETIGSVVNTALVEIIKDPSKALQWIEVLRNLSTPGTVQPQLAMRTLPATVGNINNPAPATDEEKLDRLAKAVDTLEANDHNLIAHLEKLADISVKKPAAFKNLLSMLEIL